MKDAPEDLKRFTEEHKDFVLSSSHSPLTFYARDKQSFKHGGGLSKYYVA
jgi:hypothetical protein